jgi:hypothetical protein
MYQASRAGRQRLAKQLQQLHTYVTTLSTVKIRLQCRTDYRSGFKFEASLETLPERIGKVQYLLKGLLVLRAVN